MAEQEDEAALDLAVVKELLHDGERTNILRIRRRAHYQAVPTRLGYTDGPSQGRAVIEDVLQQLILTRDGKYVWRDVPVVETL